MQPPPPVLENPLVTRIKAQEVFGGPGSSSAASSDEETGDSASASGNPPVADGEEPINHHVMAGFGSGSSKAGSAAVPPSDSTLNDHPSPSMPPADLPHHATRSYSLPTSDRGHLPDTVRGWDSISPSPAPSPPRSHSRHSSSAPDDNASGSGRPVRSNSVGDSGNWYGYGEGHRTLAASSSMQSVSTLRRRAGGGSGSGRHRPRSLLRRGSSFGGAPIVVQNKPPPPQVLKVQASSNLRWIILLLSCLLLFGNYYAYDNPAALNRPLQEYLGHDYDLWQYELNLLYAVYSLPNMFLPFVGGQLVDRHDPKKVLLGFSFIVCAGQTLFAIGVQQKNFATMVVGRVLFGIGGESISVVQSSITTAWFKKKELAFALGLNLCISRFGSVVNAVCSPRIEHMWGSAVAVWVGSLTCYLSFLCAVVLAVVIATRSPPVEDEPHQHHHHQNRDSNNNVQEPSHRSQSSLSHRSISAIPVGAEADVRAEPGGGPSLTRIRSSQASLYFSVNGSLDPVANASSSSLTHAPPPNLFLSSEDDQVSLNRKPAVSSPLAAAETTPLLAESGGSHVDKPAKCGCCLGCFAPLRLCMAGTFKKFSSFFAEAMWFPPSFWLICLICVLLYGTVIPFNTIASDFLMSKWYPNDTETAGLVMSIPDSMSAILVPICGAFVDRYGNRVYLLMFCSVVIACVHLTLGLTYFNPVVPMVFLGLSYSIYGVAIWPSIATIIQHQEQVLWDAMPEDSPMPKLLGSAYGLSTAALNTALTIMPLVAAQIRVVGGSFVPVEMFFVSLAAAGLLSSLVLWLIDRRNGSLLQKPEVIYDGADEHPHGSPDDTSARSGEDSVLFSASASMYGSMSFSGPPFSSGTGGVAGEERREAAGAVMFGGSGEGRDASDDDEGTSMSGSFLLDDKVPVIVGVPNAASDRSTGKGWKWWWSRKKKHVDPDQEQGGSVESTPGTAVGNELAPEGATSATAGRSKGSLNRPKPLAVTRILSQADDFTSSPVQSPSSNVS
ncbi:hypothetical protein HDU96_002642 [Phlyctochytrium bullatum]|nr:hypothetical protein HDU96_002642 [Phlyctochytrium bullatum]